MSPLLLRALLLLAVVVPAFAAQPAKAAPAVLRLGAVFPLKGSMSSLAREEFDGVLIARDLVNAEGGVHGRRIALLVRDLEEPNQTAAVMGVMHRAGVPAVLGAYSSALSIPASAAAQRQGLVYWEAGAVADRLTGRGLPLVFRVGASGADLGTNSAHFAATQLAPRLHRPAGSLRIVVVHAADAYADSVAAAAVWEAHAQGMPIVGDFVYDEYAPRWAPVLAGIRRAHPNILILASHIPDGIAFRRAFLAAHLYVDAFIGSTMAQCMPNFGNALGSKAIGVFASDRPEGGFNAAALRPGARTLYRKLQSRWRQMTGQAQPSEEALAGFSAAWALFHTVLPAARSLTPAGIAAAARAVNLPSGSLPNGAGIRFAADPAHRGQNVRAAAVIWQWQAVRHSVVVWPAVYATGHIRFVPLPR